MSIFEGVEWRCRVCGRMRPDEKISVFSSMKMIGVVPMQMNVLYCNDSLYCADAAKDVDFFEASTEVRREARGWRRFFSRQ